jgi:anti-sigma regulatory factor (Ser/Thr protein kinase)
MWMPTITLQAKKENFEALMEFVVGVAEKIGFQKSGLYKINLAAEEAIINVIKYAYPDPQEKEQLTLTCEPLTDPQQGLKLQIIDRGTPFDPLAQADPETGQSIEKRPIGGLGIYMIKNTADHVSYKRKNDTNILTIIFYLPDKLKK